MFKKKWLLLAALSVLNTGCFHDEELQKEVFNVNTRVLALENELQDKQQMNSRQYVTASSRVSQMQEDLLKIKGEIDRLQVGVQRGEMPGLSENEPSIGKQVTALTEKLKTFDPQKLEERMLALEKAQNEILGLLEKLDKKKGDKSQKKAKLNSLKAIEHAFESKHYTQIVDDAPHYMSGKNHKDIDTVRYYYSESLFKTGNVKEAAISFGELLKKETHGDLGPKIRLRMGDCFQKLGDKKTAIAYYKLLVEKFPSAPESEAAKKLIKKLQENPT